jgi:hypothetical protein
MNNFSYLKKVKIQDFKHKTSFFLGTLSYNLWTVLATWLHLGAPQKLLEK